MGTTREETRLSKFRNRTSVLIPVYCLLSAIVGYNLSGPLTETKVTNQILKLCNERPFECKFKYDILMYTETGKVPYKAQEVKK
jgi:hypothetical protein